MGHGGFHGGLWQRLMLMMLERLMLMMLEAEGACGPQRLLWRLVAAADAHDAGGRGGLWATEASMEACGSG